MLRGKSPRSPVWLRKIPSTVSGSQGSRRGFPPAVRFAFPLGARLNITLRARPCQELFSESFCRPSRGPRGAFALRASALRGDEFGIIRAPARPAPGKPSRTQDADNSSAVERRGIGATSGRETSSTWRFSSLRMRERPRRPGACALRSPGAFTQLCEFNYPYIRRRISARLQTRALPPSLCIQRFPCLRRSPIGLRQTSRGASTNHGCFRRPRARRRVSSCTRL